MDIFATYLLLSITLIIQALVCQLYSSKNNDKIYQYCHLAMTNITGPQAIYLDKGIRAISVDTVTTMKIRCTQLTHIKTLHPPLTIIELQPTCSAFSPKIKLSPYFEQYSKGFPAALKTANLAIPKFPLSSFRIWDAFNVSNITPVKIENLRKLPPAPSIPVAQLKAQITRVRQINPDKQTSWMYITGGGSGTGLLLPVVIGILIWRCKYPKVKKSSPYIMLHNHSLIQRIQTWCIPNWVP